MKTYLQFITEMSIRTKSVKKSDFKSTPKDKILPDSHFEEAAKKAGHSIIEKGHIPKVNKKEFGDFHGWLTRDKGTFYHVADHQTSARHMAKHMNLPDHKDGHIAALKDTGVTRISSYGDFIAADSHHHMSPPQQRVIKDAMHNKGYGGLTHQIHDRPYDAQELASYDFKKDVHKAVTAEAPIVS